VISETGEELMIIGGDTSKLQDLLGEQIGIGEKMYFLKKMSG